MTKTVNKRNDIHMPVKIRKKLSMAICMLLISCIMLVGSTYAWFVLSTAPEVSGITTNVGANGNLEMMLLNKDSYASTAENLGVESELGDSSALKGAKEANVKWGNLVDLTDEEYGLSDIKLMPAKLNVKDTDTTINGNETLAAEMLLAPSYGSDGRVIEVNTATYPGIKKDAGFEYSLTEAGVRAIGTTSGVTIRLSAYRAALSSASNSVYEGKTKATASLSDNAQALSGMIIDFKLAGANANYYSYLGGMKAVIDTVGAANGKAEEAIKSAILAYNLSANNTDDLTDAQVTEMITAINGIADITAADAFTSYDTTEEIEAAILSYGKVKSALDSALSVYTRLKDSTTVSQEQIKELLSPLVDISKVTIAGASASEVDTGKIASMAMSGEEIPLVFGDGSGVYDDLADMFGTLFVNTSITIDAHKAAPSIFPEENTILSPKASMSTEAGVNGTINDTISIIKNAGAPEEKLDGNTTVTLGDTYGYALDFGFRTNAASSNLLLQTAAAQRVYEDNPSDITSTQGGGSYMEFTSANVNLFSVDEMKALMSAIRIAFVSPKTGDQTGYDLLAIGALEVQGTDDDNDGKVTYKGGTAVNDNGWKAGVYLYNYTIDNEGYVTLGTMKEDTSAITSLSQNIAKKITVIVYLDGSIVDNTMVANANTSMSGNLNLQFSSDVDLKPMENTGMRAGGEASKDAPEVTYTAVTGTTIQYNGQTATIKDGVTLYNGSDGSYYYSKDNGATYTKLTSANYTNAITVTVSQ